MEPTISKSASFFHHLALQHHPNLVLGVSFATLLLLGWLDYITGYEFGFFIFYFVPVACASWYGGKKTGILLAITSAICWYISDRLTHHPYSAPISSTGRPSCGSSHSSPPH